MTRFTPVPAPRLTPPPISIVTASEMPKDDTAGRWVEGIAYQPESDGGAWVSSYCTSPTANDSSNLESQVGAVEWAPYILHADDTCSTFGFTEHDWMGRAQRRMDVATPKGLEHELWSGAVSQADGLGNRCLAPPTTALATEWGYQDLNAGYLGGSATYPSIRRAFEVLEQFLSDCGLGARGMIHCRPEALPYLTTIRRDGDYILTARDTIVVPGTGYPQVGPNGATPVLGNTWMFATGIVEVRIGDIVTVPDDSDNINDWLRQSMDRDNNTVTVRAERPGLASWDGVCHGGIQAVLDS